MYKEEIDLRLINIRKRLDENMEEYTDIEQEIDDLAWQMSDLEDNRRMLETEYSTLTKQIENLETELIEAKSIELDNTMTENEFRNSFIKCSFFCRKQVFNDEYDDPLRHVKITENKLLAMDGSRGIIIKCDSIPDKLKNTYIKWCVRDDFEKYIEKEWDYNYFDLEKYIEESQSDIKINLKQDKFLEKLLIKSKEGVSGKEIVILKYYNMKVAFDKRYIDTMLMDFEGMDITVYYPSDRYSSMVIESDNQKCILLPMRLDDSEY